jgi:glycyl-tRNA synthetase beta chain
MHGLRDDVMEAVLQSGSASAGDLVDLFSRMKALQAVTVRPDFDSLIVGFKRASRIVGKERWDRKPVDVALFTDAAETGLHRQLGTRRNEFGQQMAKGRYSDAVDALVKLKPAIDAFFEAVMVNAEDSAVRANRLSLLKEVDELFLAFADFSRIVVQGT